ncbi:hypothetical protein FNV43_RR02377 [Rhamnella rubrinervis]|uniref:Uncharacterized protein n=1 Tax=Rhamnella rubrinervis TaxID=2594499 RepID=A0A8K0HSJ1_9ROSA|nr:hypothetical protein FNV43_RR02377 [Rhamnella rubrinervis]
MAIGLLKRLRKLSEKSISSKATIATAAAAMKKRSCEVEESFNALQVLTSLKENYTRWCKGDCSSPKHVQPCQLYNDDPRMIKFEFNSVGARCVISTMTPFGIYLGLKCPRMLGGHSLTSYSIMGWQPRVDGALYFIRKMVKVSPGLFSSNVIITDCFVWWCCLVYALKFIKYLIAGRQFEFNNSHIALFREKFIVEIFILRFSHCNLDDTYNFHDKRWDIPGQ